jgi:hypothetical protein
MGALIAIAWMVLIGFIIYLAFDFAKAKLINNKKEKQQ